MIFCLFACCLFHVLEWGYFIYPIDTGLDLNLSLLLNLLFLGQVLIENRNEENNIDFKFVNEFG